MTTTAEPDAPVIETPARRRPRFSRGFRVVLTVLLVLVTIVGCFFAFRAYRYHHRVVDGLGRDQTDVVLERIAKAHGGSLRDAALGTGVTGTQWGSDGETVMTGFPTLTNRAFTLQLLTSDGYRWRYDSTTGFSHGGCMNVLCWFGIQQVPQGSVVGEN